MTLDGLIDIHCHILPGIDDGASDLEESVAMARLYAAAGFAAVVATPHFIPGTAWAAESRVIAELVAVVQARLDAEQIPLRVYAGMEIAFHKRLAERLPTGSLQPLAASGYYLIEPEFNGSQEDLLHTVRLLLDAGQRLILAHAERISAFQRNYDPLLRLAKQGLEIQVNSGSLLNAFGERCRKTAMELLANKCVHYLASDAHSACLRTPPSLDDLQRLTDLVGKETLERLWCTSPARLLVPTPKSIQNPLVDNAL